ncbi:glycosyltransferase family 4 protein [Streptomonospora salina]|uniref:Glycosyltransferase involved in cell wall biosynthesis n=1 Tax=Streptomonospora salina TaxID=104205 RepID=A0A841E7Y8_9ACTN|nr:glycosyltransferase family 4 protein [Streptomonospora salina]MBB5998594.1 glycosyltransferase involved in cell wall biosynthesis [Streptomonospora salina]
MTAASPARGQTGHPATVHAVLPGGVDDATRPSGGDVYDRRMCRGLAAAGRPVAEIAVPGAWPRPAPAARARLARSLAALPDGALVLGDGLVCCAVPGIIAAHARRLRLAVLVHLPLAAETGLSDQEAADLDSRERAAVRAAGAVVATSPWAARWLADRHGLEDGRTHTVEPGADPAPLATGTDGATRLLCVASLTPRKGHDVLAEALASLTDLEWTCTCAGPADRAPGHAADVRRRLVRNGIADRVHLAGPLAGAELEAAYAAADLAVLPSRWETYGMAVTEALARGVPVLTTDAGALPSTLAPPPGGEAPGMTVPAGDPAALASALRDWFGAEQLRDRLRRAARRSRRRLRPWPEAAARMESVLGALEREPR